MKRDQQDAHMISSQVGEFTILRESGIRQILSREIINALFIMKEYIEQ